ncbi:MAG TPA: hypothetical protein VFA01_00420 [Candidatus Dormibacteraeota bacterium]|jgi:uncharacterized protein with HEPN domain|nr:hypothetical protein [Candidatus Dormibacteraeota bacterium]
MGEIVDIGRYASARDRKLLANIVQSAQLAQAYATYERSYFLSNPDDQRKIAERLGEMAQDAAKLSSALRQRTPEIPWSDLIEAGTKARADSLDPAELWTAVKRVVPRVTSALAPLAGDATSVFAWTPPPKPKRGAKKAKPSSTRADSRGRR